MSKETEPRFPSEVVLAMRAEEEAAERIAAARQEAADLLTEARERARRIRARAEGRVTRMSRTVSERCEIDVARIEKEHEAALEALDAEQIPGAAYRAAAASVAAVLLGIEETPEPEKSG